MNHTNLEDNDEALGVPDYDPGRLHRIHAAPANGLGGRSFDLGPFRWRPDGGAGAADAGLARAMAYRLALAWNLCEGLRTEALEAGVLREEAAAVQELLSAIEQEASMADLARLAKAVRDAGDRVEAGLDRTHGRLHDCTTCLARTDQAETPLAAPDHCDTQLGLL